MMGVPLQSAARASRKQQQQQQRHQILNDGCASQGNAAGNKAGTYAASHFRQEDAPPHHTFPPTLSQTRHTLKDAGIEFRPLWFEQQPDPPPPPKVGRYVG